MKTKKLSPLFRLLRIFVVSCLTVAPLVFGGSHSASAVAKASGTSVPPALLVEAGPTVSDYQALRVRDEDSASHGLTVNVIINGTVYTPTENSTVREWDLNLHGMPVESSDVIVVRGGEVFTGYSYSFTNTVGTLKLYTDTRGLYPLWVLVTMNPLDSYNAIEVDPTLPYTAHNSALYGIYQPGTMVTRAWWIESDPTVDRYHEVYHGGIVYPGSWTGIDKYFLLSGNILTNEFWMGVSDNAPGVETLRPTGATGATGICQFTWRSNARMGVYWYETAHPLLYLNMPVDVNVAFPSVDFGVDVSELQYYGYIGSITATVVSVSAGPNIASSTVISDSFLVTHVGWTSPDMVDIPPYFEILYSLGYSVAANASIRDVRPYINGTNGTTPYNCLFGGISQWPLYLPFISRP